MYIVMCNELVSVIIFSNNKAGGSDEPRMLANLLHDLSCICVLLSFNLDKPLKVNKKLNMFDAQGRYFHIN